MGTKMGEYLCTFCPSNPRSTKEGYVYTHVLVAEKKLGRYLNEEEVVHHIDENKYNNSEDNLMVFKTKSDHTAFHKGSKVIYDENEQNYYCIKKTVRSEKRSKNNRIILLEYCPICGKLMTYGANKCIKCFNKERSNNIPERDILKNLIRTKSFCEIGKMYDVTDNAIRKWCKKYGLPFKKTIINKLSDVEWEIEEYNI